ncbi:peptidoglycan DD-metalloendopeptidase family protein [Aquibacillus halophilus]|uniref:Peptidoglycan DD-metalloendopeptidase family protein n=1 Tax=Aquibacillus halophilus TaxID=930132 RepID=A0A6A8DKS2_9BACI|nr:M23 family metallopeptidase [Aquibacillus halophilus]MRH44381.1 peptidoglycan DD-metalloendopeptidase family protein [Aquibacillus halophilus]
MLRSKNDVHPRVKNNSYGFIKKTALITCLSMGVTFGVVYADDSELDTVFHVYINGEHVGMVDSKQVIQSYIDQMIEEQKENYEGYSLTVGEEISYVTEKVFEPTSSNKQVMDIVQEELSVKVNAYEVKIGDKVLGYFKDQETAEATLTYYKTKYVELKTLERIENVTDNNQEIESSLSVGDSKVIDVQLSEKVSFSQQKVLPQEVISEEDGQTLLEKGTLEDKKHKVAEGEVLGSIASKYDLNIETILKLNSDITEDSVLQIGQEINVTDYQPFLDVIVNEEELVEETIGFEREVVSSDKLYKGDTSLKQEGQNGKKEVHYAIEKKNGKVVSKNIVETKVTQEPVKEITIKGTKVVPSRGTGQFQWPAVGGRITSHMGPRWGTYHKGMDIAGVSNRAILASDNGTVASAGWDGGYGNKIVINHNNGYRTIYAHLSSINVSVGQTVVKGSTIGSMGSTGHSTGVHLHFEVHKNGSLVNPASLF